MTNYTMTTVKGAFALTPIAAGLNGVYLPSLADQANLSGGLSYALAVQLNSTATFAQSASWAYLPGCSFSDTVTLTNIINGIGVYGLSQADAVGFADAINAAHPVIYGDVVTLSTLVTPVLALTVLQGLKFNDAAAVQASYGLSMYEAVTLNGGMFNFFSGSLTDGIQLGDSQAINYYATAVAADALVLSELWGNSLLIALEVDEEIVLDDAEILNMIYAGDPLLDTVRLTAGWVTPDGNFTAWAINTRNNYVTEYRNWSFNSFVKSGHKYLGASSEGLFELNGADDAGSDIPALLQGGLMDLGDGKFTAFKAAYLGMRIKDDARDVLLKLVTGDGVEYVYAVKPNDMRSKRVDMGKGLRSRYFSWALVTAAADFDLDNIQFLPLISNRRI